MKTLPVYLFLFLILSVIPAEAVEEVISGSVSYNTSDPTNTDIANWTTGWGASGITGWNYVGEVINASGTASGVYLGNDWVITAGHVGSGTFSLSGSNYIMVPGSAQGITVSGTPADLTLFQITTAPVLPSLTISSTAPAHLTGFHSGDQVVMIGYGGNQGETWGMNTVTSGSVSVTIAGYPYTTTDFETAFGTTTRGSNSATNNAAFVLGDSGGGDFVYDSSTGTWELTGINEAIDTGTNGYMVELGVYASQIDNITAVPEPSSFALLGIGCVALLWWGVRVPLRKRRGEWTK
ncbi:MAG: trypsin-like serine protease [Chthoniobacteraceae bacterium]